MKAGGLLFILGVFLLLTACNDAENHSGDVVESRPVLIQPLGGFPEKYAGILQKRLQQIVPNVSIARPIPLASNAYFEPLHRYRADSLLYYLHRKSYRRKGVVVLGLTYKDISTTTHGYYDYGVMGLARSPGDVCIVSTYRLSRRGDDRYDQLFKVAIHELAHTEGLGHCELSPTCYMKDSKYKSPTLDETGFCITCKTYLQKRGWKLE